MWVMACPSEEGRGGEGSRYGELRLWQLAPEGLKLGAQLGRRFNLTIAGRRGLQVISRSIVLYLVNQLADYAEQLAENFWLCHHLRISLSLSGVHRVTLSVSRSYSP